MSYFEEEEDWGEYVGGANWTRGDVAKWVGWLIGAVVAVFFVLAVIRGATTGGADWNPFKLGTDEPFRAWNECPLHDMATPYPYNTCNRHSITVDGTPAPLGNTYGVQLLDNKKSGCTCTCTCPRKNGQGSKIIQASSDLLKNSNGTQLPSVSELQTYAKNMWNSVLNGNGSPVSEMKPAKR